MSYNKELISSKLLRWERFIEAYHLPSWEELPSLELYMDQVIILLTQYLSFIPLSGEDAVPYFCGNSRSISIKSVL